MSLISRLRKRAIGARSKPERAYWTRALLRARARARVWDDRMLNGHPAPDQRLRPVIMRAVASGLIVTSTTGDRHAPTSWHYKRRAVDFGNRAPGTGQARQRMVAFQRSEARHPHRFRELFGPANDANVKNGQRITLAEGTPLEDQHDNHVHVAV